MTDETMSVIPQSPLILLRVGVWAKVCTVLIEKNADHVTLGIGQIESESPIKTTVMVVTPCDQDGKSNGEPLAIEVGVVPEPGVEPGTPVPMPLMPPEKKVYMPGDPANE